MDVDGGYLSIELAGQHQRGSPRATADVCNPQIAFLLQSRKRDGEAGLKLTAGALARAIFVQIDKQLKIVHRVLRINPGCETQKSKKARHVGNCRQHDAAGNRRIDVELSQNAG